MAVVPCGGLEIGLDRQLALSRPDEVLRHVPDCGEVGRRVAVANPAVIVAENHVDDPDVQFAHSNTRVTATLTERQPVISVDAKKKELVGDPRDKPEGMLQERGPYLAAKERARRGAGV